MVPERLREYVETCHSEDVRFRAGVGWQELGNRSCLLLLDVDRAPHEIRCTCHATLGIDEQGRPYRYVPLTPEEHDALLSPIGRLALRREREGWE